MGLSTDLISQFVKATKDDTKTSKEKTVYGVISSDGSTKFVKLDGASDDTLIPVTSKNSTVDVKDGDRVTVLLKDHKATVTGNLSDPAARVTRMEYVEETVSKTVTTDMLKAEVAEATKLKADKAYVDELNVKMGEAETFIADQLIVNEKITANEGNIEKLQTKTADIEKLVAGKADISVLEADYAKLEEFNAVKGTVDKLDSTYAKIDTLESDYAKIDYVDAVKEDVKELDAGVAKIDTLIFGEASGDVIQSDFSNAVVAQIGDAQIKSAMIAEIDASKIKSGSISTNDVTVTSDDGKLVIADETIQIKDSNAKVRVQIGKDAENDYSINIWDAEGNLMFSKGGLEESAVKKAIIRDAMVTDDANISASKLDIDSLFSVINSDNSNTIKSTKVYLDEEGQTLEVAFKEMTTNVTDMGETVSSQGTRLSAVEGKIESEIWQQDIDTAKNEMSTQYSSLEQEVGSFKSTVSSTYATKTEVTDVQTELDNLEIGGRNLMLNSKDGYAFTGKSFSNSTHSGTKITCTVDGGKADHYCMVTNRMSIHPSELATEFGTEITFSADVKIVGTITKPHVTFDLRDTTTHAKSFTIIAYADPTITDKWQRVSGTAAIVDTNGNINGALIAILYDGATLGSTIEYRRVKVERGNKPTDWTASPEDIESDINNLGERIASANTVIEQNTEAINARATKTEVSTAKSEAISEANANTINELKNYSTTAQMNAAIQLKAEGITSSVSATYATKESLNTTNSNVTSAMNAATKAQTDINNLSVGGRNYAALTNFKRYLGGILYEPLSCWKIDETKITAVEQPLSGPMPGFKINISGDRRFIISGVTDLAMLKTYRKCFDSEGIEIRGQLAANTNTIDGKFVMQFTVPDTTAYVHIGVGSDVVSNYYLDKLKIECGTKATDWTPAPEDMASVDSVTAIDNRLISAESSITQLSNKITANVTETTNLGTRMSTVEQTASGLTARLNTTDVNVANAAKTATNYLDYSSSGLVVGDMTASTLGKNVRISSSTVDIREGSTTLASFGANTIYLGKNSETAVINLCNGSATMRSVDDSDFKIYTDKRLVMAAYSSALLDCWRDSTHMTRISMQSADPDASYMWGGIFCTIYQDVIKNTFDMSGNTTEFKIINGTTEATVDLNETRLRVQANNTQINCTNGLYVGYDGDYKAAITLGYKSTQAKSIRWYWSDNAIRDAFSNSNGQITYVGPGDIDQTTTTMVRGQYVRLYAHEGGAVYLGYSGSTAVTSDRNMKTDILDIDDKYIDFFDRLRPITYKYDCPGNKGHRDHVGFIAQEVEEALIASGLTTEQFAGLIIENDVTLNPNYDSSMTDEEKQANEIHYDTLYSLRYEEFISILVKKVQSLQEQINQLRSTL